MTDPFVLLQQVISDNLAYAAKLHKEARKLKQCLPAKAKECFWTAEELVRVAASISTDVDDLAAALEQARQRPQNFKSSQDEQHERESFVMSARSVLQQIRRDAKASMQAATEAIAAQENRAELLKNTTATTTAAAPNSRLTTGHKAAIEQQHFENNERFLQAQKQTTQATIDHQNKILGSLSSTLKILKQQAVATGEELDVQNEMLGDLDHRVEKTSDRLKSAQKKLDRVYKAETGESLSAANSRSFWFW